MYRTLRFYSSKPAIRPPRENIFLNETQQTRLENRHKRQRKHKSWIRENIDLSENDSVVFFSASRANYDGIGRKYLTGNDSYSRIMGVANEIYEDYVFGRNDFRLVYGCNRN